MGLCSLQSGNAGEALPSSTSLFKLTPMTTLSLFSCLALIGWETKTWSKVFETQIRAISKKGKREKEMKPGLLEHVKQPRSSPILLFHCSMCFVFPRVAFWVEWTCLSGYYFSKLSSEFSCMVFPRPAFWVDSDALIQSLRSFK